MFHACKWPMVGTIGICTAMVGAANLFNGGDLGVEILFVGLAIVIFMMVGWFSVVIKESESGIYDEQVDKSFRWNDMVLFSQK